MLRETEQLRPLVHSADSAKIIYQVDWSSGPKLQDSLKKAGSGVIIHVIKKLPGKKDTVAVFTFDNVDEQLYFVSDRNGSHQIPVTIDNVRRLRIRNACFWGVASSK